MKKKLLYKLLVLLAWNSVSSQALSQGYNFSTQTTNNSSAGVAWTISGSPPFNPWISLNSSNPFSQGVALTGFTFNIPSGATIVGVEATVGYTVTNCKDSIVKLTNGGLEFGINKATNVLLPTAFGSTDLSYGGSSDTWGSSLTPATINSSSFGIVVYLYLSTSSTGGGGLYLSGAQYNSAKMKVYYSTATGIIENQQSGTDMLFVNNKLLINTEIKKIQIYDLLGNKVFENTFPPAKQNYVDLSPLNTGLYFYKLSLSDDREMNNKIYID